MGEYLPLVENFKDYLQIECPDKEKLLKYLKSKHASAFLVTDDYKIYIGLQGNHAPLIKSIWESSGVSPTIIEKGQISPLKGGVTFETSSSDKTSNMAQGEDTFSGRDMQDIQKAVREKLTEFLGPIF